MSDYLWDKSGEADPEIERLEKLLAPMGHKGGPMRADLRPQVPRVRWIAVAAAVVIVAGAVWTYRNYARGSWNVAGVEGRTELRTGEWMEPRSKALLSRADIGDVDVEPNSRIGVVSARDGNHRLTLQRGAIRATIWSKPGWFSVETPSAVTVDLGCVYRLEVDESGAGRVHVIGGWVAFVWQNRESLVPGGAACQTRPGMGPGVPYYIDASDALRSAVEKMDVEGIRGEPLNIVLREARERDKLTLWHLLARADRADRPAIYDRLASLVPPPPGVTREGALGGDEKMMTIWWNAFDLGNKSWFGQWKVKR
jgi:hypothetical protein